MRNMATRYATWLALALLTGCEMDSLVLQEATREGNPVWPRPLPSFATGKVEKAFCPGGTLKTYASDGKAKDYGATVAEDCTFGFQVPGVTTESGLRLEVVQGNQQALGIFAEIPKRSDAREGHSEGLTQIQVLLQDDPSGLFAELGESSTVASLMLVAKAQLTGVTLSDLPKTVIEQALSDIVQLLEKNADAKAFRAMVHRIRLHAAQGANGVPFVASFPYAATAAAAAQGAEDEATASDTPTTVASMLSTTFLSGAAFDYTGDGQTNADDQTTAAFDAALAAAVRPLQLELCYPTCSGATFDPAAPCDPAQYPPTDTFDQSRWIRVVFLLDMNGPRKNRNCQDINRFHWAHENEGSGIFIVGGVHTTTPICSGDQTEGCLTQEQSSTIQNQLGNWQPNQVPMYDDGTNGDRVAGDNIWTYAIIVPYIPTFSGTDQERPGVRLSYKYTWAVPGSSSGWTGHEEWPGNSRLLEVEDIIGDDQVVTRYDCFGDETTNKDVANLLAPVDGCPDGRTYFHFEQVQQGLEACPMDSRENLTGPEGSCNADQIPSAAPNGPVLQQCFSGEVTGPGSTDSTSKAQNQGCNAAAGPLGLPLVLLLAGLFVRTRRPVR